MLHVFHLDVAKVDPVLHCCNLYTCVASVCFKYFSCFKCIWQVFYLDVAYVAVAIHVGSYVENDNHQVSIKMAYRITYAIISLTFVDLG